jgi:hypothetical protein
VAFNSLNVNTSIEATGTGPRQGQITLNTSKESKKTA